MIQFFRSWHRPSALSFDLDDTLYANDATIDAAEKYMLDYISANYLRGEPYTHEMYALGRREVLSIVPELIHDVSLLRFFIYQRCLLARGYKKNVATDAACELMHEFVRVRSQVTIPDKVIDILGVLARHYPLIAISNGNINLKNTALDGIFCFEMRPNINLESKPSSSIFTRAAYQISLPSSEICHIGDNEITDVQGAINAGMMCVWQTGWKGENSGLKVLPHVKISDVTELLDLLI